MFCILIVSYFSTVMGISLSQYRASIGLFRCGRYALCSIVNYSGVMVCIFKIMSAILCILLLLFLSGDIELNPGPFPEGPNYLRICHANVRGLRDKLDSVKNNLIDSFDIIAITESRLTSRFSESNKLNFNGYHPAAEFRKDRVTDTGGGIIAFISEHLGATRRRDLEHPDVENMFIEIRSKNNVFLLCICYRPPDMPTQFWDDFQAQIDVCKQGRINKILITGDLNADPNSENGPLLQQFSLGNHMDIHINEPTRITETTATILDQFISNFPMYVVSTNILPPISTTTSTSDHCTIAIDLNFKTNPAPCFERHIWDYKNGNYDLFRQELSLTNWETCFVDNSVDESVCRWSDNFLEIASKHIPNRTVTIRPNDKPYYTSTLRRLKRKVNRLYHKARKSCLTSDWANYKEVLNQYNHDLEASENEYNDNLCNKLKFSDLTSPRQWWSIAKNFLGYKKNSSMPPISDGQTEYYSNSDKANAFNAFFLSHSNLDTSQATLPDQVYCTDSRLTDIMLSESEVLDMLENIDTTKATGPDSISPKMLREAGKSIVPSLTKLLNMSLSYCTYPSSWKKANVSPLHKKNDKSTMNNYRPISLLSCVSKIFERLIFKYVFNYLRDNKLITIHQSGFIPGDGTVYQLASLYHTICQALDSKKDVRIVFLDISKAFDRVWHDGIVYKLKCMGVDGPLLEWFKSYLSHREQRVVIGSDVSEWGEIKAGVPQGSVLGPLLFLIYINDLSSEVQCNIKLYADDSTIFITVDDPQEAASLLNSDLTSVHNWAKKWLVTFSPPKTESMLVTFKDRSIPHPDLIFDNTTVTEVSDHKHLGVTINNTLNWNTHVTNIACKASERLDTMSRLMYRLDRRTLETMYMSFIRPKLEYADIIWADLNENQSEQIELIQKRAGRIVSGAIKGTSRQVIYNELGWVPLEARREQHIVLFIHKVINGYTPVYLQNVLPDPVKDRTTYSLRNNNDITSFQTRLTTFYDSLFPTAVRLWNLLDPELKLIADHDKFRTEFMKKSTISKANPLYYYGNRKIGVILARIRMRCSILKAHLHDMNIIDDRSCACGYHTEDEFHFFFICPLYSAQRIALHEKVSELCIFNLHTLLYGRDELSFQENCYIHDAVSEFITTTNRF